jgi:hypothetical protein
MEQPGMGSSFRVAEGSAAILEPVGRDWREAASMLVSRVHAGLSRRWRPAKQGRRFDLRRTLRTSLATGGEVVAPRWRARPHRRPRLAVLIDGSRSMEAHVRPALQMAVALAGVTLNVEVFTFSTALRRITRDVRRAAAGERVRLELHDAWGGGTTIGAVRQQHDLAEHSAFAEHIVRAAGLLERQPLRDQRLDLPLYEQAKETTCRRSLGITTLQRVGIIGCARRSERSCLDHLASPTSGRSSIRRTRSGWPW